MLKKIILFGLSLFLFACNSNNGDASSSTPDTPSNTETAPKPAPTKKGDLLSIAQASNVSASTKANLSMGYWHIGGAVNIKTDEGGEGYVGKWIQFRKDMTYTFGQDDQDLDSGVWLFNEDGEYIEFRSKTDKNFYINEWKTKQIGDIIILTGNTPNNPTGGQIKLVRQDTKVIDHNPN